MSRFPSVRWLARWLMLALAAIFGCGLASGPDERLWPGHGTQATRRDFAYVYLAQATESPAPCASIAEDVYSVAALNSPGTKIALLRSSCFNDVAVNGGRADLCEHVRSVSSLLWDGSGLSRARCREMSGARGRVRIVGAPHPLDEFMSHLGYPLDPPPDGQCASGGADDRRHCIAHELWMSETRSSRILDRLHRVDTW